MESGGASVVGRAKGQYATAKTLVWWDIEDCEVPKDCDPRLISHNIISALAEMGYTGVVVIYAYGGSNLPSSVQQALISSGISLRHVPAGVRDGVKLKILVDMLCSTMKNPPPANYLLISGDGIFSDALHQLDMRTYNILLVRPQNENVSQALLAAAKSVWLWTSLLAGGAPVSNPCNGSNGNSSSTEAYKRRKKNNRYKRRKKNNRWWPIKCSRFSMWSIKCSKVPVKFIHHLKT